MRENHSHLLGLREESIALCSNLLLLALLFLQPYCTGGGWRARGDLVPSSALLLLSQRGWEMSTCGLQPFTGHGMSQLQMQKHCGALRKSGNSPWGLDKL